MEQIKKDDVQEPLQQQLDDIRAEMCKILSQVTASQRRRTEPGDGPVRFVKVPTLTVSHTFQSSHSVSHAKDRFNALLEDARAIERILHPHPIARMPDDIVLEIFQAAAAANPDAPLILSRVCNRWKLLVLNTPRLWTHVHILADHEEVFEALEVFVLFSGRLPLEVTVMGAELPRPVLDSLVPHGHRILSLEIRLQKEAREPFRVLRNAPSGGLRILSRLAVGPLRREGGGRLLDAPAGPALESAKAHNNALDATDMNVIQLLPALRSLTALVLHDVGTTQVPPLE